MWKGYKSNLKCLKVWGCLVKVELLDPKKRKLSHKTNDCVFIGYAHNNTIYRFLVLKTEKQSIESKQYYRVKGC